MARWTVKGLLQSTAKLTKWRERGYSSSKSRHVVKVIPYAGTNLFVMQQEHFGLTVNAHHIVNLSFYDVKITYKEMPLDFFMVVPYKNRNWYIEKPDLSKTPFRCRCTCPDFYFRFAYWNWKNGAIFGPKPRQYVRKTRTRPRVNPNGYPGFCKHIHNGLLLMQSNNWTNLKKTPWYLAYPDWERKRDELVGYE
jgi:hypothetical protein